MFRWGTSKFVKFSSRKIKRICFLHFLLLSPVHFCLVRSEIHFQCCSQDVLDMLGVHDFLPSTLLLKLLAATLCDSPTKVVCSNIMFLIAGYDTHNLNMVSVEVRPW